jgi:hypothetical protein
MSTPNFVLAKMAPRAGEEVFIETPKWPLSEVAADTLSELCDAFREEVFRKAGKPDPRQEAKP